MSSCKSSRPNREPRIGLKEKKPMEIDAAAPLPPQAVIVHVRRQVTRLNVLRSARETDLKFQGQGRYEAENYLTHQDELDSAWSRLAEFEQRCQAQGFLPALVYAVTGEPARLSPDALAWLADLPAYQPPAKR
jgi:hypothetical protein